MEQKRKRPVGLIVLSVIVLLLLAAPAAVFLYDAAAGFDDYDDAAALVQGNAAPVTLQAAADWTVTLHWDKADIYSAVESGGGEALLHDYLQELTGSPMRGVKIVKTGFHLDGTAASAQVKLRLLGFLPLQLRAEAELELTPETVTAAVRELKLGKWISLSPEGLAKRLDLPELAEGFQFELPEDLRKLKPDSVRAEADGLVLHTDLVRKEAELLLAAPSDMAGALRLLAGAEAPAEIAAVCGGGLAALDCTVTDMESLSAGLTGLAAAAEETTAAEVRARLEALPFLGLKLGDTAAAQEEYTALLQTRHRLYEETLNDLRERYKRKELTLSKTALLLEDGQCVESLLPEAWEARTVLQYNQNYNAIVRESDGIYSTAMQTWLVLPNPDINTLNRASWDALPNVPGVKVFDLTLALRMADGTPAILYCMAEGATAIDPIPEELFDELVHAERLPFRSSGDMPMTGASTWFRSKAPDELLEDLYLLF